MKPTTKQVLAWAREATKAINADEEILQTKVYVEKLAAIAYAAGVKAMKERATKVCADMWCKEPEPGDARDCHDAICALGENDD